MIKKQTQNAAVHIWRIIHTIRVKILGLELSLWLVINKGLGRFVLTPDSCLQPLCEGTMVRTAIRRPSFLLLPCVPHPFLVSLKVSTLEDSIQTPPFPYNLPWPEQGSLKISSLNHSTRLACTDQSAQGCCLTMLSLWFSGLFKRNTDHSLFLCVCATPAGLEGHSPLIWFVLRVGTSDPGPRQMPEELPGLESFV